MNDLAVEHRAALGLIYPIADALQMKLFYNSTAKGVRIRGAEKMTLPIDGKDETIPFEVKVHASTVGEAEAWALMRVRGDLWVLLGYLQKNRELQFCIVDASKAHIGPVTADEMSGLPLVKVAEKLARGIVAVYYRRKEESDWRAIDGIDSVDEGQPAEVAAGDRAADSAGTDTPPGS